MKAQILKIAGVKSEKEFYKKYKTEADFMKVHGKEFKKAQTSNAINKAQGGQTWNGSMFNQPGIPQEGYTPGTISLNDSQVENAGGMYDGYSDQGGPNTGGKQAGGLDAGAILGMAGSIGNVANAFASQNKQKQGLQQQGKLLGLQETLSKTEDVDLKYQKHINNRPEDFIASTNMFYPAKGTGYDILRGVGRDGTTIRKAQDGINNFGPEYDIYSDLEYEPLYDSEDDSDNVKRYAFGGKVGSAVSGQVSNLIGAGFDNNAGFQAGSALGGFSDLIIPGSSTIVAPILGAIGGGLDQAFGSAGDISKLTASNAGKQERIFGNSIGKNIGFTANRQEGGYMNPEYNPQVITMFGDHTAEDFADYAHKFRAGGHLKEYTPPSNRAMEIYADGGEVTSQNLGETQVESGGSLKPISFNPHNDGTGWTSEIQGQYHSDYNPQLGHSGVIFNHGGNEVEAERGELLRQVQEGDSIEGGKGELSANITGNLELQPIFGDADPKYKPYYGMKIKNAHKVIADKDKKLNLKQIKIDNEISNLSSEGNDSYSKLKQTSLDMMKKGIDQQYKANAEAADYITNHQTKVNDLVDQLSKLNGVEYSHEKFAKKGILSDILAKGEISQAARNGKTIKAQTGITTSKELSEADYNYLNSLKEKAKAQGKGKAVEEFQKEYTRLLPDEATRITSSHNQTNYGKKYKIPNTDPRSNIDGLYETITNEYEQSLKNYAPKTLTSSLTTTPLGVTANKPAATELEPIEETKKGFPWLGAASSLIRGLYPAFNMPIGSQINPELYDMADNNVEGLNQPHMYYMLKTPDKYSADRDKTAILSQARQAVKNAGNNPAAQAAIMAQVADAMGQVSSKEFDINQQQYQGIYNDNIATVNKDKATNLGIDIDSAMKLSQAKSNLQAKKLAAMTSAEAKIAANKRENMEYNIGMAEHPDFTFGPDGRIIKLPRFVDFDTSGKGVTGSKGKGLAKGKEFSYDDEGNIIGVHSAGKESTAKNGKSIKTKSANSNVVKAFKGF